MRIAIVCLAVFGGLWLPATAKSDLTELYRATRRAAVEILADGHHSGSGCFVSAQGHVVTAAHVVASPRRTVEVLTADGTRTVARVVAVDLGRDLVVLQVAAREGGYPFLKIAKQVPPPGTPVWLGSSAAYRRFLLQPGTIARDDLTFEHQDHFVEVTQVVALIQEGTSGGPWVNRQGQLIGIQSGTVTVKGQPAGIANVAPAIAVLPLLDSGHHAASTTLGVFVDEIWLLSSDELRRYPPGWEGMVVQSVKADGPAAQADIRKGDVITAWEDTPLRFRDDFVRRLRAGQPGDTVALKVFRPDGTGLRTATVQLGCLEAAWEPSKP
jgi:S1-C subfamily serine protease